MISAAARSCVSPPNRPCAIQFSHKRRAVVLFAAHTRPRSSARPLPNSPGTTKCTMKRFIYIVCLFMPAGLAAAIPMARVINVIDSHTITVEVDGRRNAVVLSGVAVSPGEEAAAVEYLHRLVDGAWVYVEGGDVYRSPDGLFVTGEMQRHAWWSTPNMRYLGLADPGPRTEPAKMKPAKAATVKRPSTGKDASRSEAPRRVPARRSPARHLR